MTQIPLDLENQLWAWLDGCESRKPRASLEDSLVRRQGGTVVAGNVREDGREAGEAGSPV